MNSKFFELFNIEPNDKRLFEFALTHRSFVHQNHKKKQQDQQERLEFFGDAVLKFIVSYYLMHKFPKMEEGKLTKIRARIISDRSLAKLGLEMELDKFVRVSESEKAFNGQQRPALLADTFEAILGAMYLDKGVEYTMEWFNSVVETHLSEYLDLEFIVDFKTYLQEQVQKFGSDLPLYECYKMEGPEHKKKFFYKVIVVIKNQTIESYGEGFDKKSAQQQAAEQCVEKIKDLNLI